MTMYLLMAFLFLIPLAGRGAQTAKARLYCLSVVLDSALDEYGDILEVSSTGAPDGLGELVPWAGAQPPGSDLVLPGTTEYVSDLALNDIFYGQMYGTISLYLPSIDDGYGHTVDANTNRFPDFFEVSQRLQAATTSGSWSVGSYGGGSISAAWNRTAGSKSGTCRLVLTDTYGQHYGTFLSAFEILEYAGTISYSPGSNTVSGSVNLTQTGNAANQLQGAVQFTKEPTNRFDQLTLSPGAWTDAAQQTHIFTNHLFLRDQNWPTNYAGYVEFDNDADPSTFYPWSVWVLAIDDLNDANHNGIPDFSDDPAPAPPRRPQLSLAASSTNLLLTIRGDVSHLHQVQEALSPASTNWQTVVSVTLTNDPQVVLLPLPSESRAKFWRVLAQ
jgi:hypothetical protein